jgi:hypothetical protein
MKDNRNTAIIVGVLFIIGTVAGVLSAVVTGSIFGSPDYLVRVAESESQILLGAFFVLIMAAVLAMVPVMMFPIFRKYNEALALGSVLFRGALEAAAYIAMVICWLLLIVFSQEFVKAGAPEASNFQIMGALLLKASDRINPILQVVFSLGALMFYYLFFFSKLIPRWLSGWGFIGAILYLASGLLTMFGTDLSFLLAPLALQEMVLALWLIFKGFNPSAVGWEFAK